MYGTDLMQRREHTRVQVEPLACSSSYMPVWVLPLVSLIVTTRKFEHYTSGVRLHLSVQALAPTCIASDRISIPSAELLDKVAM